MTHAKFLIVSLPVVLLILLASGCGLKGDLYLPEKSSAPVLVTPASSSSSASSAGQATP